MKIKNLNVIVRSATKRKEEVTLIKNFSYDFKNNNVYAIIGKNGSGKSSLLKEIFALFLMKDIDGKAALLETKTSKQILKMTVYDYMEANYKKNNTEDWFEVVKQDFAKYGLSEKIFTLPFNDVSGGEKKLLKFMSVINESPSYFLLDEPEFAIAANKIKLVTKTLEETKKNSCIIIVTHDFEFIKQMNPTCLFIDGLRCNEINTPKTLKEFSSLIKSNTIKNKEPKKGGIDVNFNFGQN